MKVISVIQPWATLIALGEKKFETRSWKTKYRGEIGIHASKKIDKETCRQEPFKSILTRHGYNEKNLPTGSIIATSSINGCYQVLKDTGTSAIIDYGSFMISGNEYHFGDYTKGRFAWELHDIKQIDPIPAKGQLGLWNYNGDWIAAENKSEGRN